MRVCSRPSHPDVHFDAEAPSVVPGRRRVSGRSIHEANKRPKMTRGVITSPEETPQTHWLTGRGQLHVEGAFFSNELRLLAEAAVEGLGITLLPEPMVRRLIAAGELVQVLPGLLGAPARASIVYSERELVPPQVRAFVDAVAWPPTEFMPRISEGCEEARAHRQLEKQRESAKNAKPLKAVRG